MRILVTGATGFAGKHLIQLAAFRRHSVVGTHVSKSPHTPIGNCSLARCDLRNSSAIRELVAQVRPDRVYHLAARSSVTQSYGNARAVYETNFWGTYNLLEALRENAPKARVLIVGSGHCYGFVRPRDLPVAETHALSSHSPYATSKAAADLLGYQFFAGHEMHIVRARPFNHTGPGQTAAFVCSDFARQVAAIELGMAVPEIKVGSLSVQRDFSDVRDVVRAYHLLLERGTAGEAYNIASGRSYSIGFILRTLVSFCTRRVKVVVTNDRLRHVEERKLFGNTTKLRRSTNWEPRYRIEETLHDLIEYWKEELGNS